MFEYINMGFIILCGISLFNLFFLLILTIGESEHNNTKVKNTSTAWILFFIAVSISIPLIDSYDTKVSIRKNIEAFNQFKELRCSSGFNKYLVSKSNDWEHENNYFIKNDLLIRADKCEITNQGKGYSHDTSN